MSCVSPNGDGWMGKAVQSDFATVAIPTLIIYGAAIGAVIGLAFLIQAHPDLPWGFMSKLGTLTNESMHSVLQGLEIGAGISAGLGILGLLGKGAHHVWRRYRKDEPTKPKEQFQKTLVVKTTVADIPSVVSEKNLPNAEEHLGVFAFLKKNEMIKCTDNLGRVKMAHLTDADPYEKRITVNLAFLQGRHDAFYNSTLERKDVKELKPNDFLTLSSENDASFKIERKENGDYKFSLLPAQNLIAYDHVKETHSKQ